MSNEKALTIRYESDHGEVKLSPAIIKKYLVSGRGRVSDQELIMFMKLCQYQRLNPFLKDAYLIKYTDSEPATMVTGKDTFTKRAERNEKYDGFEAGIYVARDGEIEKRTGSMHLKGEEIVGGWARVHRKDRSVPVEVSVSMDEYMGRKKDGTPNRQWSRMPGTMIRKVALVQALREAFPADFQGLYDSAEMSHIDGEQLEKETPVHAEVQQEEDNDGIVTSIKKLISQLSPEEQAKAQVTLEKIKTNEGLVAFKRALDQKIGTQEEAEDIEYTEEPAEEALNEAAEKAWEENEDDSKEAVSIGKSDGNGIDLF